MSEPKPRILVVEDEAVVLHTLQLILRQHGYEVKGARDGAEAMMLGPSFDPQILLCDINLPDIDGIRVALGLTERIPNLRVVLLSGEISSAELLDEAERHGHYFEVLAKPTEPQQLLRVLSSKATTHRDTGGIHRVK
ncbi:MAG TPA: response regulator [Terriglobales bacterium]|nr:response regulator [Terriglobales bacterium]